MLSRHIGRCVYCGTTEGPLTTEHIVAYGLGGEHELLEASCGTCANLTSKIERTILRRSFGNFRITEGIQTRRPKFRPKELALDVRHPEEVIKSIVLPVKEYPTALKLPIFAPARILRGLEPADEVKGGMWAAIDEEALNKIREKTGVEGMRFSPINPVIFNQMLAKIALCYAVHQLGPNGFTPLVTDVALGQSKDVNYLVGGMAGNPPGTKGLYHLILWQREGVVLVGVQLFAAYRAPMYHVVVGSMNEEAVIPPLFKDWREGETIDLPMYST